MYLLSERETDELSSRRAEAIVLFSLAAFSAAFAVGLWVDLDTVLGEGLANPFRDVLLKGVIPMFGALAFVFAGLGCVSVQKRRHHLARVEGRTQSVIAAQKAAEDAAPRVDA